MLAAFVSPNDAVIAAILKDASQLLEAAGHSGSIDGYQSQDPSRVWMLAGADRLVCSDRVRVNIRGSSGKFLSNEVRK